jgi:hypothetical protein
LFANSFCKFVFCASVCFWRHLVCDLLPHFGVNMFSDLSIFVPRFCCEYCLIRCQNFFSFDFVCLAFCVFFSSSGSIWYAILFCFL